MLITNINQKKVEDRLGITEISCFFTFFVRLFHRRAILRERELKKANARMHALNPGYSTPAFFIQC